MYAESRYCLVRCREAYSLLSAAASATATTVVVVEGSIIGVDVGWRWLFVDLSLLENYLKRSVEDLVEILADLC